MSLSLSRREFLKLSALASLGLALGAAGEPITALAAPHRPAPFASPPFMLGPGSLIESDFGQPNNFEALVLEGNRLVHLFYINSIKELYWQRGQVLSEVATGPATLIESSFGKSSTRPGNFEAILLEGNALVHYFKDNGSSQNLWRRAGYAPISTRATGPATFIESSSGKSITRPGNFELIALEGNELVHYYKDNSSLSNPWRRAGYPPISTHATGPATLIEVSAGRSSSRPGNFELIALEGNELVHYYKDNSSLSNPWRRAGYPPISTRATGPACLIESSFGRSSSRPGNFELIVPEGNELVHYFKDNSSLNNPWRRGQTITTAALGPGVIIQSSQGIGTDKNFEVLVQEGYGSVIHYTHPNQNVMLPWTRRHVVTALGPWPVKLSRTRKVVQLTGETDLQLGQPTINQTETYAGLRGTDLGASFEHKGATYFLFGDTWRTSWTPNCGDRNDDLDAIASTTDRTAYDGLRLTFNGEIVGREGDRWRINSTPPLVFENGQRIRQGAFEVPLDGFSHAGQMYVFFSADTLHYAVRHKPMGGGTLDADVMGRSVLAVSTDEGHDGYSFDVVYEVSREKFINVSVEKVANGREHGIPEDGEVLLMWGSGRYRGSDVYLAYIPINRLHERGAIRYYAGLGLRLRPTWSSRETDAMPLFSAGCVGELSCRWNRFLGRWILMFNGDLPRGIVAHLAERPWGPWTDTRLVFEGDDGYGRFIHRPGADGVNDTMFGCDRAGEYGGEYGPYQITRYTTGVTGRYTKIYFTLSTWNPYQVMQMSAIIPVEGDSLLPLATHLDNQAPYTLKFAGLSDRLVELAADYDLGFETERQGSRDYTDHLEWASFETVEMVRDELLARLRYLLAQREDRDMQARVYAEINFRVIELGGALDTDQPEVDWLLEQGYYILERGDVGHLLEMTAARLAQPELFRS